MGEASPIHEATPSALGNTFLLVTQMLSMSSKLSICNSHWGEHCTHTAIISHEVRCTQECLRHLIFEHTTFSHSSLLMIIETNCAHLVLGGVGAQGSRERPERPPHLLLRSSDRDAPAALGRNFSRGQGGKDGCKSGHRQDVADAMGGGGLGAWRGIRKVQHCQRQSRNMLDAQGRVVLYYYSSGCEKGLPLEFPVRKSWCTQNLVCSAPAELPLQSQNKLSHQHAQ